MTQFINYQVLARTTRPTKFSEMIGQDSLIQTLKNAIESGRLAHAFILTGTRGVGKTTTARLIARALNCVGEDGKGQPTSEPCGQCDQCQAIADDRHMDVIEVDAATRTGVDDMRQLLEGVSYKPVMGRYKIYIIDEVHMLSKNAFNSLLKTLEEPPAHVKFIFATTEIRKIPPTILSRCQRFDLRRIPVDILATHFAGILEKEKIQFEPEALNSIARAANGSVRDGLSLLDQAIVRAVESKIAFSNVQEMLGLSSREKIHHIFVLLMKGLVKDCLEATLAVYMDGADPEVILQDLLETTYRVLSAKTTGSASLSGGDLQGLCDQVKAQDLMLLWQVFIKGIEELKISSLPFENLEVILIRAMHIQKMIEQDQPLVEEKEVSTQPISKSVLPSSVPSTLSKSFHYSPKTFQEVVDLFEKKREPILVDYLIHNVSVVHFEPGLMRLNTVNPGGENFHPKLIKLLSEYTGMAWAVESVTEKGQEPLGIQRELSKEKRKEEALSTEEAKKISELFPGAHVVVK